MLQTRSGCLAHPRQPTHSTLVASIVRILLLHYARAQHRSRAADAQQPQRPCQPGYRITPARSTSTML